MIFVFRHKCAHGFTLVEIMIVVAIIGLLVTVAIPSLLRSRVNANEAATKANIKAFSTANEAFRSAQQPPAYAVNISSLTTAAPTYLDITWGVGVSATKSGYVYTYVRTDDSKYALVAEPESVTVTGNHSFCVDETGQVWTSNTAVAAFVASPCSAGAGAVGLV